MYLRSGAIPLQEMIRSAQIDSIRISRHYPELARLVA
jgi:hypothetical protein